MGEKPALSPNKEACSSPIPQTPQGRHRHRSHASAHTAAAPISLPKRHSSLAFSSKKPNSATPAAKHNEQYRQKVVETPVTSQSNIGKKRSFASPTPLQSPSHVHKVFQAARGALHRDMCAASSPASSIESRMNLDQTTPFQPANGVSFDSREWRYSTAPQNLAIASIDVREPLPSPSLPEYPSLCDDVPVTPAEPVSSGFVSPIKDGSAQTKIRTTTCIQASAASGTETHISPSGPASQIPNTDIAAETGLDRSLYRLRVGNHETDDDCPRNPSPERELRSQSDSTTIGSGMQVSPHNSIYLSEAAEAAAESAKAKRRWLRGFFFDEENQYEDSTPCEQNMDKDDELSDFDIICPDPTIHRMGPFTSCLEPPVHERSPSPYQSDMLASTQDVQLMRCNGLNNQGHRATATGSPMPFARVRPHYAIASSDRRSLRTSPAPRLREPQLPTVNEHFQPGWYYAREESRPQPCPTYSFSTAASKVMGSDQAPDSRMRDSYNTDTLTALPLPATRYRKNGIGAGLPSRGLGRFYQRQRSLMSTSNTRPRPSSRQTFAGGEEVRFRSSPPRGSTPDDFRPLRRKRAVDDSFLVATDRHAESFIPQGVRLHGKNDYLQMDEVTQAVVRRSVFGMHSPEALRNARQGIRELSPNVQVYRKGTYEHQHLRKKRRPSYWDNDLKEVRESPAGRGGVRSPVSAQESMKAEFEVASQRDTEMELDVAEID